MTEMGAGPEGPLFGNHRDFPPFSCRPIADILTGVILAQCPKPATLIEHNAMSLIALILLSQTVIQDNKPQIRLGHRGAPFSMTTQSRITCNLKHPTELKFSANRTGVQLLSPKLRLAEDKFDASGLRDVL
jgi:hypothetical protein